MTLVITRFRNGPVWVSGKGWVLDDFVVIDKDVYSDDEEILSDRELDEFLKSKTRRQVDSAAEQVGKIIGRFLIFPLVVAPYFKASKKAWN